MSYLSGNGADQLKGILSNLPSFIGLDDKVSKPGGESRPFVDKPLLNLGDIEPGLKIQLWHRGEKSRVVTVTSYPFFRENQKANGGIWVKVESKYTGIGLSERSLADMGVVPYDWNGAWNGVNCATKYCGCDCHQD